MQGQWSINTGSQVGSNLSTPPGSPAQAVEFATPQSAGTESSEGMPLRYRTDEVYDYEYSDYEYSGVCYFVAEEPRDVDEALTE